MAYEGYLLKVGAYKVPADKYIAADTYTVATRMQDVDPWTDADGYLHRNAVSLKAITVEFETPAMLTDTEFEKFMSNVRKNYISAKERSLNITAFIPETGVYVTQKAYLADITPSIYGTYDGTIKYNPIKFSFVGGVK